MRPILWAGLLAVCGMSLYVASQGDEAEVEVLARGNGRAAATTQGDATHRRLGGAAQPEGRSATPAQGGASEADGATAHRLALALEAWQERIVERGNWPALDARSKGAWGSQMLPLPAPSETLLPPPPVAPSFPYQWVGRYVDGASRAIIAGPSSTWVLKANDVIEGQWRVDAIEERQLRMTYLPLQQSITVIMK